MENSDNDPFGRASHRCGRSPDGWRWCGHCSGYGSSLKQASDRCTHCGGSGVGSARSDRPRAQRDVKLPRGT